MSEEYGIIPDEEIDRIKIEVVDYLSEKKRQGTPACAPLTDIAKAIGMDRNRLLRYAKSMTGITVIKPAQLMITATGFTITDDWYIALEGEDCFGSMARTTLKKIQQEEQIRKALQFIAEFPTHIESMTKEVKELGYDLIDIRQKLGNMGKKIDEIYEILTKGGVKYGRKRKT